MPIRHVRTQNGIRLDFNRTAVGDLMDRVGKNRLANVGKHMQTELQKTLTGPRSGRIYPHPHGGTYQASAPGEPPAKRTGDLRDSINWKLTTDTRGNLHVAVGTDLDYGIMLERGTGGRRPILPRPWLRPTFDRQRDNIKREMSKPWK